MKNIFRIALEHQNSRRARALDALTRQGGFKVSMEEEANGKVVNEIEHVIYAKLSDLTQLKLATRKEYQEQWTLKVAKTPANAATGSVRIRKTFVVDGEGADPSAIQYILTTKIKKDNEDKIEVSVPTSEENFIQFKFLAADGLIKDRYSFPVIGTELVWEVDMFLKPDGSGYWDWVKIDLEVTDRSSPIPDLPIRFDEIIWPKGFGQNDAAHDGEFIQMLYQKYFNSTNLYVQK